jgi:hypothetical protein
MRSERERRECFLSLAVVGLLRAVLAAALLVSTVQAHFLLRERSPAPRAGLLRALPLFLLLAALAAGISGARTLRRARKVRRAPVEPPSQPDA